MRKLNAEFWSHHIAVSKYVRTRMPAEVLYDSDEDPLTSLTCEDLARHEAGHVFVGAMCGGVPGFAYVGKQRLGLDTPLPGRSMHDGASFVSFVDGAMMPMHAFAVAGMVASPNTKMSTSDAEMLIEYADIHKRDISEVLKSAIEKASELLPLGEHIIEALASKLLQYGFLHGKQIRALLHAEAPSVSWSKHTDAQRQFHAKVMKHAAPVIRDFVKLAGRGVI